MIVLCVWFLLQTTLATSVKYSRSFRKPFPGEPVEMEACGEVHECMAVQLGVLTCASCAIRPFEEYMLLLRSS